MTSYQPHNEPHDESTAEPPAEPPAESHPETPAGPPAEQSGPPATTSRRRGALLVVAALLAGLVGGFAGAAGWAAVDDDETVTTDDGQSTGDTLADRNADVLATGVKGVQQVAASVLPSVVKIDVRTEQGAGSGSGVLLSSDGQILTNNHVVEGAVGPLVVSFDDGTTTVAEVVGTDSLTDLAVIQAEGVEDMAPASLGSSDDIAVGEEVVAVGSPFGLESTVTSGIVSAVDRPVDTGGGSVFPAIQTDAAINPGNSGGALVDLSGNVVGINTAIRTSGSTAAGSIGLGFAIPIDQARPIAGQLAAGETPTHARMGVSVDDAVSSESGITVGALIEEVEPDGAGEAAGLRADDVIVGVADLPVRSADGLVATIRKFRPGDEVTVTYVRDENADEVDVTLQSDEGTPAS